MVNCRLQSAMRLNAEMGETPDYLDAKSRESHLWKERLMRGSAKPDVDGVYQIA